MNRFEVFVTGHTTLEVERPLPLVTSEPDLAWQVLSLEVQVTAGEVVGATLAGSITPVVLTDEEEIRALCRVEDNYDPDDHYVDDAYEELRCERRRELLEDR